VQLNGAQPLMPHSYYEELCALAAAGQLTSEEWVYLRRHLDVCEACREVLADFSEIALVLACQNSPDDSALPPQEAERQLERFVARARSEGIPLAYVSVAPPRRKYLPWFRPITVWPAIAVLVGLFSFLTGTRFGIPEHREAVKTPTAVGNQTLRPFADDLSKTTDDLRAAEERERSLSARLQAEKDRLAQVQHDKDDLTSRLAGLDAENSKLRNTSAELAASEQETERLRSQESAAKTAALVLEVDLKEARASVVKLTSQLNQERQLTAALEEARRLIVSRNVHVIDIGDVNSRGKKERPSGRIFYVEKESLLFYAYDLHEAGKLASRDSFYVWGTKDGSGEPARSLGRLESDDKKDDRWSFRLSNPDILARINTVFVTAEPNNTVVKRPTGEQIMTTSLAIRPNHP
jgi:hypothetical protein